MIALIRFVLAVLASPFKSKSRLEAENAVLRHQLIVLRRRLHGRVRLTNHDRWFLVQLYRWFPPILKATTGPDLGWGRDGGSESETRWKLTGQPSIEGATRLTRSGHSRIPNCVSSL